LATLSWKRLLWCYVLLGLVPVCGARAQEPPYFVTYSDALEEPGNLELASQSLYAAPKNTNAFYAQSIELEYGVTAWYTAELYLQGQSTEHDSTVFTGFRIEQRFRPLRTEHWINPVLYVEYEDHNHADKSFLEVMDHDVITDQQVSNAQLRASVERAVEGKLILSSNWNGFNLSENIIAEKSLSNQPWEFGYALGASRALASAGSTRACRLCRQNLAVGGEIFGGLGTRYEFGFNGTSIYSGPTLAYRAPRSLAVTVGPEFGLNANSAPVLWRMKVAYEFAQIRDLFGRAK
jgi:hypothetical protein